MRIALYHHLHSGGARRVVLEQARRLATVHDVTLFSLSNGSPAGMIDASLPGVKLQNHPFRPLSYWPSPFGRLNPLVGLANLYRLERAAQRMADEIDAGDFDVALVHPCQFTQAPMVLRRLHTPTVYYCHELPRRLYEPSPSRPLSARARVRALLDHVDPLPRLARMVLRHIDRANAQAADQIVTNSRYTQSNVTQAYARDSQVCSPGVDSAHFHPTLSERQSFVFSVGALTPNKGFDFIIEALATLPPGRRPPLLIVSNYQEAAEHAYLTQLARERQVGIDLRCDVPESTLAALYATAGCVAYAPIREPFGLVALEAMASAAPLVGVDEGGVSETVIHQACGLLAPRDAELFGQAIHQLLQDRAGAQALGQRARAYVADRWTWERHIQQLECVLQETAGRVIGSQVPAGELVP